MTILSGLAHELHQRRYAAVLSGDINAGKDPRRETWEETLTRVADYIGEDDHERDVFYHLMAQRRFLPNSPTIINAGGRGTLSGCFTLSPDDDMESILNHFQLAGRILKHGGGIGYELSRLRPAGALVKGTGGRARGPVAALHLYQSVAAFVEQAGKRDGAQMAILRCDHPDISKFINSKVHEPELLNTFNISVAVTDEFMKKALEDGGNTPEGITLWEVVEAAHGTGDPGLYFIDEAERHNPTPHLGKLEGTNPCGEVPMLPYEACNLGSLNLTKYVRPGWSSHFDLGELNTDIPNMVLFLDRVIDKQQYPAGRINRAVVATRKIGLGVMGWADSLALLDIHYDTKEAVDLARSMSRRIKEIADRASMTLSQTRGPYPARRSRDPSYRNATRTCIAPTGSISILAGCSSGIEPHWALEYQRKALNDLHPHTVREPILGILEADGSDFIPKTALEITPEWHIAHQAAWQENVDLAVSKTVNLPNNATTEDVYQVFVSAWKSKCKGVTVFRDGCRDEQVLNLPVENHPSPPAQLRASIDIPIPEPREPKAGVDYTFTQEDKPIRKPLPPIREAKTHKFRVGDEEGYATIGHYEDGRPGELFITLNKEGSAVRGWADLCATFVSIMLQYGVPLDTITTKMRQTRFAPAGLTGDKRIPAASSIPDYIAHLLEHEYAEDNHDTGPTVSGETCPDCGGMVMHANGCMRCPLCGWERC